MCFNFFLNSLTKTNCIFEMCMKTVTLSDRIRLLLLRHLQSLSLTYKLPTFLYNMALLTSARAFNKLHHWSSFSCMKKMRRFSTLAIFKLFRFHLFQLGGWICQKVTKNSIFRKKSSNAKTLKSHQLFLFFRMVQLTLRGSLPENATFFGSSRQVLGGQN